MLTLSESNQTHRKENIVSKSILVKRYKDERAYQKDAQRMVRRGYKVTSVTSEMQRAGCARILTLGIFTLLFPPKPQLVVTYILA